MTKQEEVVLNVKKIRTNKYPKEKDLQDSIINNIQSFCNIILEDEYITHQTEYNVKRQSLYGPRPPRVDIYIQCKNYNYIIEVKNPLNKTENIASIGQILNYGRKLDPKAKLVIVTSYFDIDVATTIKYYNLPIKYIFIDNNVCLEFLRYN